MKTLSKTQSKKQKISYLQEQGNGIHRWGGALYEVKGNRYRQVYTAEYSASVWRTLK